MTILFTTIEYATITHKSQFIAIFACSFELISYLCSKFTTYCDYQTMSFKEIGQTIKERRRHLGVNQLTLSELSGVSINTLVSIERGEGNPQLSTLLVILDTLGLKLDIKLK